jgi:hypothetical protein
LIAAAPAYEAGAVAKDKNNTMPPHRLRASAGRGPEAK